MSDLVLEINAVSQVLGSAVPYEDRVRLAGHFKKMAQFIINKNWVMLSEILSAGRGFNDNSKKGFCKFLGVRTVLSKNVMDNLVAEWTGVSVDFLSAYNRVSSARKIKTHACNDLIMAFSNGDEVVGWVDERISAGAREIEVVNRKSYLVSPDRSALLLKRKVMKDYAVACIEFENSKREHAEQCLNVRANFALRGLKELTRESGEIVEFIMKAVDDSGFNEVIDHNGVQYLTNSSRSGAFQLHDEFSAMWARQYIMSKDVIGNYENLLLPVEMISLR